MGNHKKKLIAELPLLLNADLQFVATGVDQ